MLVATSAFYSIVSVVKGDWSAWFITVVTVFPDSINFYEYNSWSLVHFFCSNIASTRCSQCKHLCKQTSLIHLSVFGDHLNTVTILTREYCFHPMRRSVSPEIPGICGADWMAPRHADCHRSAKTRRPASITKAINFLSFRWDPFTYARTKEVCFINRPATGATKGTNELQMQTKHSVDILLNNQSIDFYVYSAKSKLKGCGTVPQKLFRKHSWSKKH